MRPVLPIVLTSQQLKKIEKAFWLRVDKTGDCWIWTGPCQKTGHGRVGILKKKYLAHRIAYFLTYGYVSPELCLRHTCDNPPCVRPDHLIPGTLKENTQDMVSRGRGRPGRIPKKLTAENVITIRNSWAQGSMSMIALSKTFGITRETVRRILNRITWSHI